MGRRKLWIAIAVGVALVAALVALQLVDEGTAKSSAGTAADAPVRVKGIEVSRPASLEGSILGASGWQVQVTVVTPEAQTSVTAQPDGHYRLTGLSPGPAEVSWTGESGTSTSGDVTVGGSRTGRTQITLDPGRNTFNFTL